MTDRSTLRNAYHEAAHCVLGMDAGRRVHRVSLLPGASYAAVTLWEPDPPELVARLHQIDGRHPLDGLEPDAFRSACRWMVETLAGDAAAEIIAPLTGYLPTRELPTEAELRTPLEPAAPSERLEAAAVEPPDGERHDDEKIAEKIAFNLVGYQTIGPLLGWMRAEARRACVDRWAVIEAVAGALLAAETLDGAAVESIHRSEGRHVQA